MQPEINILPSIASIQTNEISLPSMNDQVVTGYNDLIQEYQINTNKKRSSFSSSNEDYSIKKLKAPQQLQIQQSPPQQQQQPQTPKSNNSITIGDEKPKKPRKNETICTICEKGDNLLMCDGQCLRSFHIGCIGLDHTPGQRWECDDCTNSRNICFACKKVGIIGMDLMKCKVHQCGKFYHHKCVSEYKLAKLVNTKAPRFNCPLHYCETCGVSGDGKQSVHCFRCPTAYHVICMPPGVKMLTKSKETRKTGLIPCPKHYNEQGVPQQSKHTLTGCNHQHAHHHHQVASQQPQQQLPNSGHITPLLTNSSTPSSFFTPMSPISSPPFSPVESPRWVDSNNNTINNNQLNNNGTLSIPSSPVLPCHLNAEQQQQHHHHHPQQNIFGISAFESAFKFVPTKQMMCQLQEKVKYELERPRSFGKRNSSGSVPSISSAPSPALSRSNSSEHLLELSELSSYASRLIEIRDSSSTTPKDVQQINNFNMQFSPILNKSQQSPTFSRDQSDEIDQSKLIGQFLQFAHTKKIATHSTSILSAPSTPNSYISPHQVPSVKYNQRPNSF